MTLTAAGLAELCAAALPAEGLTAADVETCCFGPDTTVLGDDHAAAVVTVRTSDEITGAWLLLVAVHPEHRRRGRGRALVEEAVTHARSRGAIELHLGNCGPRYVWPGVDYRFTAALALFESCGFVPYGAECNMAIATSFRAAAPAGVTVERETGEGAVDLARRRYPGWVDETERATAAGGCFAARAGGETLGFACHSANRAGWIGPMATDPDRRRGGVGSATLAAACADLGARGHSHGDIAWVGPIGFYAKCGATVSRVFRTARLTL
ncbi:MAG TPA: GNAT family N-acetyltransferase [Acidimicrobiia bacterium]